MFGVDVGGGEGGGGTDLNYIIYKQIRKAWEGERVNFYPNIGLLYYILNYMYIHIFICVYMQ